MVIEITQLIMISKKNHKLIILGGGGHAISCIELLDNNQLFDIAGYLDTKKNIKIKHKYLGDDSKLINLKKKYNFAIIAIGQIKNSIIKNIPMKYARDLYKNPRLVFCHKHWLKILIIVNVVSYIICPYFWVAFCAVPFVFAKIAASSGNN